MSKIKRAIFAVDWHYPLIHKPTLAALLNFLKREPVDVFIYGGDQHDNACISHHNKSKPMYKPPGAFQRDTAGFWREVMEPVQLYTPNAQHVWIDGNHERFADDLIEEHPEFAGIFDRKKIYKLAENNYTIVPLGHSFKMGRLSFVHGEWLTGIGNQGGTFPAKKLVEITATNTIAGHTHAAQSFTRISPVSQSEKWMGWISPIMGATNPAYIRNRPTAWLNGFTLVEYHPNGNFNTYPIIISAGKFVYGGKEYGKDCK